MLKKLVKYGNSTALVLDRAILELLNIKEGGLVKLKTDGSSLIITPEPSTTTNNIFLSNQTEIAATMLQEALTDTPSSPCSPLSKTLIQKSLSQLNTDPLKKAEFEKCAPGTENFEKLSTALGYIMEKYREEINKLSAPKVLSEINALSEKYKNDTASDEYLQALNTLRLKHAPLLKNMDAEMLQAHQTIQNTK